MREESTRVLLVEDDAVIRETTQLALQRYGHQVTSCADGLAGLAAFEEHAPDVTLLDVMLPRMDGIEVCRRIRRSSQLAVLMLSARTDPLDVVHGLEVGADDYVTKPFSPRELVARVKTVLRRATRGQADRCRFEFDGLVIDTRTREVLVGGRAVELTVKEFDLLVHLASAPRQVFSRSQLLQAVWRSEPGWQAEATVTEHVHRLRHKVETAPARPQRIRTVRGIGYRFEP